MEVDFDDLEANLFFAVLYLAGSIVLTLRHDYFLQCADFNRVDFVDPEARF